VLNAVRDYVCLSAQFYCTVNRATDIHVNIVCLRIGSRLTFVEIIQQYLHNKVSTKYLSYNIWHVEPTLKSEDSYSSLTRYVRTLLVLPLCRQFHKQFMDCDSSIVSSRLSL